MSVYKKAIHFARRARKSAPVRYGASFALSLLIIAGAFVWVGAFVPQKHTSVALVPEQIGLGQGTAACFSSTPTVSCDGSGNNVVTVTRNASACGNYGSDSVADVIFPLGSDPGNGSSAGSIASKGGLSCAGGQESLAFNGAAGSSYNVSIIGQNGIIPFEYDHHAITAVDCTPIPPTPAQGSLSASCDTSAHNATMSWAVSAGATKSQVCTRDDAVTGSDSCSDVTAPTATKTVSGLFSNYHWWVNACNAAGCSAATTPVGFSCQSASIAGNVSVSPPGPCQVAVGADTCPVTVNWSTQNAWYSVPQAAGGQFGAGQNLIPPTQVSLGTLTYNLAPGAYIFAIAGAPTGGAYQTLKQVSYFVTAAQAPQPDLTAGAVAPTTMNVGVANTLTATITNSGGAATGAGFSDLLQKATDINGAGATDIGTFASGAIGASSNNTATFSYTPPSAGTYYLRACADKSSAGSAGIIAESNEGNNCGAWTPVTVAAPGTISATISGRGCSLPAGGGTCDIASWWSVTGLPAGETVDMRVTGPGIARTVPNLPQNVSQLTQANKKSLLAAVFSGLGVVRDSTTPFIQTVGTAGSFSFQLLRHTNQSALGSVFNLSACPSGTTNVNETCTLVGATQPDLTVGIVSPVALTAAVANTVTATVFNVGTATGAGFSDLLQKATDASGTGATDIGTFTSGALGTGLSNTASFSYTPTVGGTYYMRVCADKSSAGSSGVITESNEGNNCGAWTAVTIGSNPQGFLDGGSCDGGVGGWSYDPDSQSTSISLNLYDGTRFLGTYSANQSRPDVDTALGITGNHGYTIIVPASVRDGASHALHVYGVNVGGGADTELNQSPITLTCAPSSDQVIGAISASPNPCTLTGNNTLCDATISWYTQNAPEATVFVGSQVFGHQANAAQDAPWISETPSVFTLHALNDIDSQLLGSVTVTAVSVPSLSLTAIPSRVRSGGTTKLTWSGTRVDSCALTSSVGGGTITTALASPSGGLAQTVTGKTTYTLTCLKGAQTYSLKTVVNLLPTIIDR